MDEEVEDDVGEEVENEVEDKEGEEDMGDEYKDGESGEWRWE